MVSFEGVMLRGVNITAPRVGICAPNITLFGSQIETSGRGCPSNRGVGAGVIGGYCSGTGGAHGGEGGHGGLLTKSERTRDICAKNIPKPYYYLEEARYEGSGGASGIRKKRAGGAGGGIIWLSTTGTINLEKSTLSANGKNGTTDTFTNARGSGGGAGGSVQLTMKGLKGDGVVSI
jgi:hypothetical protein